MPRSHRPVLPGIKSLKGTKADVLNKTLLLDHLFCLGVSRQYVSEQAGLSLLLVVYDIFHRETSYAYLIPLLP